MTQLSNDTLDQEETKPYASADNTRIILCVHTQQGLELISCFKAVGRRLWERNREYPLSMGNRKWIEDYDLWKYEIMQGIIIYLHIVQRSIIYLCDLSICIKYLFWWYFISLHKVIIWYMIIRIIYDYNLIEIYNFSNLIKLY